MFDPNEIKSITICSSSKFYSTAKSVARELSSQEVKVFTPRFEFDEALVQVSLDDKINLTLDFLEKIRNSDAIYVIAESGYTGRSVCIEVGYASALGKTVILSEEPAENAVMALTHAVVPTEQFAMAFRLSI